MCLSIGRFMCVLSVSIGLPFVGPFSKVVESNNKMKERTIIMFIDDRRVRAKRMKTRERTAHSKSPGEHGT